MSLPLLLSRTQASVMRRRVCGAFPQINDVPVATASARVCFSRACHNSSQRSKRVPSWNPASRPWSSSKSWWQTPRFSFAVKMSSAGGAGIASAGLYAVVSNPMAVGAKPEDADEKAHHLKDGKGFINPWDSYRDFVGWQMGLRLLWRKFTGGVHKPDTTPPTVPVITPTFRAAGEGGQLRATWLGHACYYVEFPSGLRVLFDPVFEDCCTPFRMKSFQRFTPVPCEIEDLPAVDLVVISHNHYDHLSYPTMKRIRKAFPQAHFFAPLGNRQWFLKSDVPEGLITELDWWDTRDVKLQANFQDNPDKAGAVSVSESETASKQGDITALVGALPCQHVSARGPFDKCKTLWASWSVESGGAKVYFAGDTGYRAVPESTPEGDDGYGPEYAHLPVCPAFKQIGTHRGPFDLGLIPIGAYEPRWVMSPMHANPEDSANIFIETRCKKALGMHWGTWVLTEEDVMEPPRKLKEALKKKGIEEEGTFDVVDIGGSREFESGA